MAKFKSIIKFLFTGLACVLMLTGCNSAFDGSSSSATNGYNVSYATSTPKRPNYHFASSRPATGKDVFIFDPKQLAWAAYDKNGNLIKTGIASGGANYCEDLKAPCRTPSGTYTVHREGGANCKSNTFPLGKGGAPMPHCAFFHRGYAVHGSYDVPAYNASHGCVRVTPSAAKWLDDNVLNNGTTVIVESY
ncbi:MAG: L,D-transpeptidase [Legionellales bacterium]|nr:L,D-transpeptidase [Legionellales bacterium]|tara:strand:+ start:200 stop:772 length:573 start_codon:yes stop_codon:yes gene_type:complete